MVLRLLSAAAVGILCAGLSACATREVAPGVERPEHAYALTSDMVLIRFNAGQPSTILARQPVTGLVSTSERIVAMDFRASQGVLYTLSSAGRLYTLDTSTGQLEQVGTRALPTALEGEGVGMDVDPVADRIRIVTAGGQNLRVQPDTGAQVDSKPKLAGVQSDASPRYEAGDAHADATPAVAAAAYTYPAEQGQRAVLYVIDKSLGQLAVQGGKDAASALTASPDMGRLTSIGPLGLGPLLEVDVDIALHGGTALMAARTVHDPRTRLFSVDLDTGKASLLGVVGDGRPVIGLAIAP